MSQQILFCTGEARRDASGVNLLRIEGWCLGSLPISTLLLRHADGHYEHIPYGFPRPDLEQAFPQYPGSGHGGFRLSTRYSLGSGKRTELGVEVIRADGAKERHALSVLAETRDIQTCRIDYSTLLADEIDQAAVLAIQRAGDIELRLRESLSKQPGLTLRLDIINKCNLRCVMCHFSDDAIFKRPTSQLTGDQFKALFDDIGPNVCEVMLSCGDEPLTSKFLPDILHYLADNQPQVAVEFCTNAMLMRAPIRKLIMETGVARLLFSIDAVTKPLLESIRVGCKYEQLLGNILALRDLKTQLASPFPAFIFNFVMMDRNIHEAPAFVHLAHALGAESIDFRHVVPIGTFFEPGELLSAHPAKFNFYRREIVQQATLLGMNYYLPDAFATAEHWEPKDCVSLDLAEFHQVVADPAGPYAPLSIPRRLAPSKVKRWEGSASEEFAPTYCARPFSEVMIRDQEEVLPCPWHNRPLGYLSEGKSLSEIFLGPQFQDLRRNMLKPEGDPNCAGCPIKSEHLPTASNK